MFIARKITGMVYCGKTLKLLALATELSGSGRGAKAIERTEKSQYCKTTKIQSE